MTIENRIDDITFYVLMDGKVAFKLPLAVFLALDEAKDDVKDILDFIERNPLDENFGLDYKRSLTNNGNVPAVKLAFSRELEIGEQITENTTFQ